jgi:hypothetical protein
MQMHACVHNLYLPHTGCIDFNNPDNGGLSSSINALQPIADKYEGQGLTRTDIWALAAVVTSEFLQPSTGARISFPFQWIGRRTCGQLRNNQCGRDFNGAVTTCAANRGPHHNICHGDSGTTKMLDFMRQQFGMNPQQVAAIMGAHTIGIMTRKELGFDSPNGWDLTNSRMDNGYFVELVGSPTHTLPNWKQVVVNMLNTDMALVRDINDGSVSCSFTGNNQCGEAGQTIDTVKRYANSRQAFLEDYRDALNVMLDAGYTGRGSCAGVCRLTVARR